jgi:WD40 repeat protein
MLLVAFARGQSAPPVPICRPALTISKAGAKPFAAIAFSPSGRLAVAGEHAICIYDVDGRNGLAPIAQTLRAHTAPVLAMRFEDANALVSVARDESAKIWDAGSGKLLHSAKLIWGEEPICAMAPGGQPFVAEAALRRVGLWNYRTGKQIRRFEANDSPVSALAFAPDGKSLVIGTFKGVVRVVEVASWKVTRMIDLDAPVRSVAASRKQVLVGYEDGTVAVLNFGELDSIPQVRRQTGSINALAFSANGKRFASASADGTIKVWDTGTLKLICSLEGRSAAVLAIAFSVDGREIVSSDADGNVNYWRVPGGN